jgi:hypothetical protein
MLQLFSIISGTRSNQKGTTLYISPSPRQLRRYPIICNAAAAIAINFLLLSYRLNSFRSSAMVSCGPVTECPMVRLSV